MAYTTEIMSQLQKSAEKSHPPTFLLASLNQSTLKVTTSTPCVPRYESRIPCEKRRGWWRRKLKSNTSPWITPSLGQFCPAVSIQPWLIVVISHAKQTASPISNVTPDVLWLVHSRAVHCVARGGNSTPVIFVSMPWMQKRLLLPLLMCPISEGHAKPFKINCDVRLVHCVEPSMLLYYPKSLLLSVYCACTHATSQATPTPLHQLSYLKIAQRAMFWNLHLTTRS